MYQKPMPKQVKGVGIIPPPRRERKGCRQYGGAANFCRSAAFRLYLPLAYHTRETRVGLWGRVKLSKLGVLSMFG